MTSRERVMTALNHEEPDRVPIDLSGHRSSGISAVLYPRLRDEMGLPPKPVRVYDPVQQLAIVHEDVLDAFNIDTIELGRGFAEEDRYWADWTLPDGTPCQMPVWALPEKEEGRWVMRSKSGRIIAHMTDGALYFEQTSFPFMENEDLDSMEESMDEIMWVSAASPPGTIVSGPDGGRLLKEGAEKLRKGTERSIIGLFGGNLFEFGQFFYRIDNFLYMLAAEPARVHRFLDRLVELHLINLERYLDAVGKHIDVILFGDDLGMQTGPQISTAMYREFFKPRHATLWKRAKELADVKVMLHCCGGIRELIPDLIEAGVDAVNPVQTSCAGMDPNGLKKDFGKDLVLWGGGCDTRDILPSASPGRVKEHVRKNVDVLGPGGGFVFQQVHNILAGVPPENIITMMNSVNG